ncbi:MAG: acetyl-CoA carboxylase carboxyltransferase subunit alpha [Alphaproteobacteria bacterium]|nr:acetyl-CoA carboxylase carboxyltransferase subunit alpha [Alphaproteobacteria bacterium]
MYQALDFEAPILELEGKIEELRHISGGSNVNIADEVDKLQNKVSKLLKQIYGKLTPYQKIQVARHPQRPRLKDFIQGFVQDFVPLAGDRLFAEDQAIIGGIGRIKGYAAVIIGHERGSDTESRLRHNFGMARPEGYRKAQRLMDLADRLKLPVICLVDTAGAYPGLDAETRGQAEAIARSIEKCLTIKTPLISIITGEGGSGGAIALAVADQIFMFEHAVYSVISAEGCASILWRSADYKVTAAEALKLTAQDLLKLKVIDGIIPEPLGGAHRVPQEAIHKLSDTLERALKELIGVDGSVLREKRRAKFIEMGRVGIVG